MYLHPTSLLYINRYLAHQPQSALIVGENGIGFQAVLDRLPVSYRVRPENNVISAEVIRSLYHLTRGRSIQKNLIVIDNAEAMSHTAQNAFLKLLEEPSPSTYFLLLSHAPSQLLPTIRSRVTTIQLTPITTEQSTKLLDDLGVVNAVKRQQLLFIADGLPALLTTLAQNDELFQARADTVRDARTLLQGKLYEKLQVANRYKERTAALTLLRDAARFLKQSTTPQNATKALKQLELLLKSYERIAANGNVRLCLAVAVV